MSTPTVTPIRDRVVVTPIADDREKHSVTRIIAAPSPVDKMKRGLVVAVGNGFLSPAGVPVGLAVQVGDVVLYEDGVGKPVNSYGKLYVVLREQEILGTESPTET